MKIKPYSDFETQELLFTLKSALESIERLKKSRVERAKWSISILKNNIKDMSKALSKKD